MSLQQKLIFEPIRHKIQLALLSCIWRKDGGCSQRSRDHTSNWNDWDLKCETSIRVWLTFHEVWPVSSAGSPNWCSSIDSSPKAAIFFPHISDQCIVVFISLAIKLSQCSSRNYRCCLAREGMSLQNLPGTYSSFIFVCVCKS